MFLKFLIFLFDTDGSLDTDKFLKFVFPFRDLNNSLRDSGISLSSPLQASTPLPEKDEYFLKKRKSPEEELRPVGNSSKRQKSFSINDENEMETGIDCTILELRSRKSTEGKFRDLYRSDSTADKLLISGIEKAELHPRTLIEPDDEKNGRKADEKAAVACSKQPEGEPMDVNGSSDERMLSIEYQEPQGDVSSSFDLSSNVDDSFLTDESIDYEELPSDLEEEEKMETETKEEKKGPDVRVSVKIPEDRIQSSQDSEDSGKGDSEDTEATLGKYETRRELKEDTEAAVAQVPRKYLCLSEEKLLAFKRKQVLKKINKLPISERYILHGRNLIPWRQKVFTNHAEHILTSVSFKPNL